MSNLPSRVQQQLEEADRILAAANSPQEQAPAAADPAASATPEPTVPEVPAPQAAVPQAPAPTPEPVIPRTQYDELANKHRVLQGMHRSFETRISELTRTVQTLTSQLEQQKQAKPEPENVDTAKDAEVFGAELVEMVRRHVEAYIGAQAQQFGARLDALEAHLRGTTQTVEKTNDDMFIDRLAAAVPDYEDINVSEGFLAWLSEVDPVYGTPRQAALTAAADARDAVRVVRIFLAYKDTLKPAPVSGPTPAQQLERQVAPRPAASSTSLPQGKPTISEADITRFYNDVARGAYRGKQAEFAAREAEINQALAEGRVI
jgi:hypothetical protein